MKFIFTACVDHYFNNVPPAKKMEILQLLFDMRKKRALAHKIQSSMTEYQYLINLMFDNTFIAEHTPNIALSSAWAISSKNALLGRYYPQLKLSNWGLSAGER